MLLGHVKVNVPLVTDCEPCRSWFDNSGFPAVVDVEAAYCIVRYEAAIAFAAAVNTCAVAPKLIVSVDITGAAVDITLPPRA